MSDPLAPPLDAGAIIQTLIDHRVRFVLVGGLACTQHGFTRGTRDVDICPAWDRENLQRVVDALGRLGAQLRTEEGRASGIQPTRQLLDRSERSNWRTDRGDVDVLLGIPKDSDWRLIQYRELLRHGITVDVGGGRLVNIAGLQDIITSKELAARPSDLDALPELRRLLASQQRPDAPTRAPAADQFHADALGTRLRRGLPNPRGHRPDD